MGDAGTKGRVGAFALRLLVAHLVAYPIAVAWMVGAIPICFPMFEDRLVGATGQTSLLGVPMPAEAAVVVRADLVVGAIVFVAAHAIALPWALARDGDAGRRGFVRAALVFGGVGVFGAAAAWIWFFAHFT